MSWLQLKNRTESLAKRGLLFFFFSMAALMQSCLPHLKPWACRYEACLLSSHRHPVCCMSGTGIEIPLRTGFVVGVMVVLEAPATACGEWALWEGLAKLPCLPERAQEANPRAAGTCSVFGMLLEQVEPHPAAAWGPCGAVAAGQQCFGPRVFLGYTSPPWTGGQAQAGAGRSCQLFTSSVPLETREVRREN